MAEELEKCEGMTPRQMEREFWGNGIGYRGYNYLSYPFGYEPPSEDAAKVMRSELQRRKEQNRFNSRHASV